MAGKTVLERTEVVATFNEREDAEAVAKRLVDAGFQAQVGDESKVQKYLYFSRPLANEKVEVPVEDYSRARHFLKEIEPKEHLLCHEIACPQCDSPDVEYPQYSRKFVLPAFFEILSKLHIIDKEFYCKRCHYAWPDKEFVKPPLDILNWRRDKLAGPQ
jgi:hypothetical protein